MCVATGLCVDIDSHGGEFAEGEEQRLTSTVRALVACMAVLTAQKIVYHLFEVWANVSKEMVGHCLSSATAL